MSEIDTPPQLSKPPDDVSPWLAYYIGQIHNAVKTISRNQDGILTRLKVLEKNGKKNNPSSNPGNVTFKWILEKLALPIIMLAAGAAVAILSGT